MAAVRRNTSCVTTNYLYTSLRFPLNPWTISTYPYVPDHSNAVHRRDMRLDMRNPALLTASAPSSRLRPEVSPVSIDVSLTMRQLSRYASITQRKRQTSGTHTDAFVQSTGSQCFKCKWQLYDLANLADSHCSKGGMHFIDDLKIWELPNVPARLASVAIDCEMIYTTRGSELAHVVVLDGMCGDTLASWYIRPKGTITDLLTPYSGIESTDQILGTHALDFAELPSKLMQIGITGRTYVIGHGLDSDFEAMRWNHKEFVIDTAMLYLGRDGRFRKLKTLASDLLGLTIQSGNHNPFEDAGTALALMKAFDRNRHDSHRNKVAFSKECFQCSDYGHTRAQCPWKQKSCL